MHDGECLGHAQGGFVGAGGGKGIVDIDNLQNPRSQRNLLAFEAIWVARSIHLLVMVPDDGQHQLEGLERCANSFSNYGMPLDNMPLFWSQRAGLEQNRVGDGNLAYVMHHARLPESYNLLRRKPKMLSKSGRVFCQSLAVSFGVRVLAFNTACQREQHRFSPLQFVCICFVLQQ